MANINSCLRMRAAFSISRPIAISNNAETCKAFSSDRCMCVLSRDGKSGGGGNCVDENVRRHGRAAAVKAKSDVAVDERGQLALGHGAHFLRGGLTVLEQDQR